jgi:tRNA pseudouridine38-40 synthase
LQLLLGEPVTTLGCGRTDTGVHARHFTAHFDVQQCINVQEFTHRVNKILPSDIACHAMQLVPDTANARFDAISRTYKYFIARAKHPFLTEYACYLRYTLNVEAMNRAAQQLMHMADFTSFAKLHSNVKNNLCSVYEAYWYEDKENSLLVFNIKANRFLRNMVRAIVGTLLDVGRGKLSIEDFERIADSKNRCCSSTSAPAHGLFLWEIEYGVKF